MATLVIDTRAPAPRKIGGGLDDPEPTPTTSRRPATRRHPTTTHPRHTRRSATAPVTSDRPPAGHPAPAPTVEADTDAGHENQDVTGHRTTPAPAHPANIDAPADRVTGHSEADEAAAVRVVLAALVPVGAAVPTLRLAEMVAAKLANHGAHCAAAVNPARGSLTVDEARARCRAILGAFGPVERHAVLALLTHDVRAATR